MEEEDFKTVATVNEASTDSVVAWGWEKASWRRQACTESQGMSRSHPGKEEKG